MDSSGIRCFGGADRDWHQAVVDGCPSLREGHRPPAWARNGHVQTLLTARRDDTAPPARWDAEDRLSRPDGGTVSIQWSGLDEPADTPVLVVLHTICGSGNGLRRFIDAMRRRLGWVVAACNRRGHAKLPLTAPQINTMGSTADLRAQLDEIERRRPGAPLFAVGVSAGSGLLVRYLGEDGRTSRFRAAVAVCPAYDIPSAFAHVHPVYDRYLTRKLIRFFLETHRDVLGDVTGFAGCAQSRTMVEFHERLFPLAGFDDYEAYLAASNPMAVATDVHTPTLVVNAVDDPVCVESNVHRHLAEMQRVPQLTLALTRFGGHCGFFDGPGGRDCWLERVVSEYLTIAWQS